MHLLAAWIVVAFAAVTSMAPTVMSAEVSRVVPAHASYDVQVWDHAESQWRAPSDEGIPEHWEWWTTPSVAVDAHGYEVQTIAFHQAIWLPGANWTDLLVTHLDAQGAVVRQDLRWVGEPPFYSDVGFNFGANNFQVTAAGVTERIQTVEESRFGPAPLPCGYAVGKTVKDLALGGSCGSAWPFGGTSQQRLPFAESSFLDGESATVYGRDETRVWMRDGIAVPARIQSSDVQLDLVGFRPGEPLVRTESPVVGQTPPASMGWALIPWRPWGLDEEGAVHDNPFPASEAYQVALQGVAKEPLALFALQHPDARPYVVQSSAWKAGERVAYRWDFVIADDVAVWNGSVVREIEGEVATTTSYGVSYDVRDHDIRLPRLALLPTTLPGLESLLARWSGWTGEPSAAANAWGYAIGCPDAACSSSVTTLTAGRSLWEFPTQRLEQSLLAPSRMQGTSSVAAFTLDGAPVSIATSDWRTARLDNLAFRSSPESVPSGQAQARFWGIEDSGAKAVAGLALAGAVVAIAYRVLPVAVGLYARIRTDALPEHPTRAAILELATTSPGIRYSDLLQLLGCGKGTLEYHLRLLENGGHVVLVKRNGLATYFRSRQAAEGNAMAWLRSTTARRILGLLSEQPRPTAMLHSLAGCSRSTAHSHLVRIEAAGLVRRVNGDAAITDAGRKAWDVVRGNPHSP